MAIARRRTQGQAIGATQGGFDALADLRRRQEGLPTILQAEQAAAQHKEQMQFEKQRLSQEKNQAKKTLDFQRDESRKNLGLSVAKFGTTALNSDFLKGLTGKLGTWSPGDKPAVRAPMGTMSEGGPSKFGTFNMGGGLSGALGGGAIGFGLGSMLGKGKHKWLGAGLGALAGGLLGGGLDLGSAFSGGSFFTGGIG